ncbi:MAG TPA: AAA family ATPase [Candidatus Limnocylindrales bacterium]|nr:AAA family ATPase [Candidatus Limnocylindrales bacterium]
MDPTAQTPPPAANPVVEPQADSVPAPSSGDQAAQARGDLPIQQNNSSVSENQALKNVEAVNNAQVFNNDKTQTEVGGNTGVISHATTASSKSSDQIRSLGERIEKSAVPEEFKQELLDRISRLAMIRSSAGFLSSTYIMEYETTSRFVNWVLEMPWGVKTKDLLDLSKAKEMMDKNHYGLGPLKQRVLEYIASLMLNIKNYGNDAHLIKAPILCIVGLAGTGKTTFAKSLADALGRQFERIPFGGMADSRVLRGQSRYFPDAEPGQIIKRLVHSKTSNPVILLDELDRVTDTARADIMGVLIEILDPEQNARFTDHYVDYPFNLQNVLFVATANNVSSVATAVLDRIEIIQMPSYNDEEKIVIGRDFVLPKTMQMTGLLPDQLAIDPAVWEPLIRPLGYDPGIRGLDRLITGICRKAATVIISGQASTVKVTNDNIKQFLPEW